ncbi:MAG: ABC transporter permease [Capsulimonadales bacterium]|nr:ABC transporter permease [Capsulimonadales bacterium]
MSLWRYLIGSLRFHGRSHLGVFLGAALATAIITGALAVGDSVRHSLRRLALARIGNTELALTNPARFFREQLGDELSKELNAPAAAILLLRGTATGEKADGTGGEVRAGRVQALGVTDAFWRVAGANPPTFRSDADDDGEGTAAINDRLAKTLGIGVGDDLLLRVDKPSLLSRDAPLSTIEDATVTLRLTVAAITDDENAGRFSLEANQVAPFNVFIPRAVLQKRVGMEGRANTLLVGRPDDRPLDPSAATGALWKRWELTDSGLELREVRGKGTLDLRTTRVFLDPPIGEAALTATPDARGVLTYFVNELRVGDRATPYSTVTAIRGAPLPADLKDDEAVVNRWFADDVGAKVGDRLTLTYWIVGPMRRLEERKSDFRIRAILPMETAADPDLMPDIPGLSDKKDCRDWEPGVPVDLNRIRDKDQTYWERYRGSPKAFITLRAGQRIWNNRFGDLTAVRYPVSGPAGKGSIEMCLRQALSPASQGLFFQPVRERALKASGESLDFGQLFLGFSLFLIVAALLLTGLLFAFGIEQRTGEMGTLLALGFTPRRVRGLLLAEGVLVSVPAALVGVGLATLYTRAVIAGLSSVWSGAVADTVLRFAVTPATLVIGALSGILMALFSIFPVTRRQAAAPVRELLAAGAESETRLLTGPTVRRHAGLPTAALAFILAVALLAFTGRGGSSEMSAGLFFGAGALLLISAIGLSRYVLSLASGTKTDSLPDIGTLARRNALRRLGRSLSAVTLLASGAFLVIAVGANRHDPEEGARERSSGTGGFALYAEASLPVFQDLNTDEGQEAFGIEPTLMKEARVLALRFREGDDASCLNLNRAQTPRLFGVASNELRQRKAFTFTGTTERADDPWGLLDSAPTDGTIPVIGDTNTVIWSLGKKLGDVVPITDDRGETHRLRIVGVLANSVLQGGLILSETQFVRLFPTQSGYQVFLIDAPAATAAAVSGALTKALEDNGLSVTPAAQRLAAFNTVENTYLSIFAILGGLGLLLGSLGLGILVLRNVWERRGELALLRAVGWRTAAIYRLVFLEHALLLTLGLLAGIVSALVAVLPALRSPGADVPYLSLTMTLLAVLVTGFLFTGLATALALRTPLLAALRNE